MKPAIRTFYLFTLTQIFSLLGSRMTGFALALRISIDSGQVTPVALVAFFQAVPELLLSNIGGLVADRYDRRLVMALTDFGQALGTVLLLVAFLTDSFQLWHLYAVTCLQAIFMTFQRPASEAVTAMLVPDDHRDRANALRQMSDSLAGIFAPALAAMLLVPIGVVGIMLFDLLTFAVAIMVFLLLHIPRPPQSAEGAQAAESLWQEVAAGYHFLRSRRPLFYLVLQAAFINLILSATTSIPIPYVLARTGSEQVAGLVSVVENAGIILGGMAIAAWGSTRGRRVPVYIAGGLLMTIAHAVFGLLQTPLLLCIGMFAIVFPLPIANVPFFSMLQSKVPPDLQGRVFALVNQLSGGLRPIGMLLIGPLADQVIEPAVGTPAWEPFAPLFGNSAGAGIGLIFTLTGLVMVALNLLLLAIPSVRTMEHDLPDYEA